MPESGMAYNMRQLEVQCANENGVLDLSDWYSIPVLIRSWKVAAMIIPNVLATLDAKRREQIARFEARRGS